MFRRHCRNSHLYSYAAIAATYSFLLYLKKFLEMFSGLRMDMISTFFDIVALHQNIDISSLVANLWQV